MLSSLLDLGPRARVALAAAWLVAQGALVVTGDARPDAAFAFHMFNEMSTLEAHLSRAVPSMSGHGATVVAVEDGAWAARDTAGNLHRFRWRDRVHEPGLTVFDQRFGASYGVNAQVARWQAALDDVAAHLDGDTETQQLLLDVRVFKNGREVAPLHFASSRTPSLSAPSSTTAPAAPGPTRSYTSAE